MFRKSGCVKCAKLPEKGLGRDGRWKEVRGWLVESKRENGRKTKRTTELAVGSEIARISRIFGFYAS